MIKRFVITISLLVAAVGMQFSRAHSPPDDARVFIIEPADGAVVTSPVLVKMGTEGFGVTPAGTRGKRRHTAGHHHVLIVVCRGIWDGCLTAIGTGKRRKTRRI